MDLMAVASRLVASHCPTAEQFHECHCCGKIGSITARISWRLCLQQVKKDFPQKDWAQCKGRTLSTKLQLLAFLPSSIGLPLCCSEHMPPCSAVIKSVKLSGTYSIWEVEHNGGGTSTLSGFQEIEGKKPSTSVQRGLCEKTAGKHVGQNVQCNQIHKYQAKS